MLVTRGLGRPGGLLPASGLGRVVVVPASPQVWPDPSLLVSGGLMWWELAAQADSPVLAGAATGQPRSRRRAPSQPVSTRAGRGWRSQTATVTRQASTVTSIDSPTSDSEAQP